MFFPFDIPSSYFDVINIRFLPSVGQILQHYELILLVSELITTCEMVQPFFGVLLMSLFSDGDAWLGLQSVESVVFWDVLLEGCKGMRDVI